MLLFSGTEFSTSGRLIMTSVLSANVVQSARRIWGNTSFLNGSILAFVGNPNIDGLLDDPFMC